MFENPRTGRQARNLTTKISKILDLKSSPEQIFSENCRWVPLTIAPTPYAFHDNSRQLEENSLRRFAIVAFFDVCDTSGPIGKPFSFLLCDKFHNSRWLPP